ncbi:MAG TPA: hypothetical protein VNB23_10555 [Ramlibacter sp.]|nr:hypothetical protein [Ramlibacter sp.]
MSAFRLRYALYCLRWFLVLAPALGVYMAWRPSVHGSPWPYLVVFFYVGLPLGAATSGLAAFGFLVGASWARRVEGSRGLARTWPKAKAWLRTLVLLPVVGFGVVMIVRGLLMGEIRVLRRGPLSTVAFSEEPLGYVVTMVVWCVVTGGLVYYQIKDLRRAHAS